MPRPLARRALSVLLVVPLLLFSLLAAAPPARAAGPYYKIAYASEIYDLSTGTPRAITYEEWAAAGFPTPQPAPTEYVRNAWSSTIYGVTLWGEEESTWQVDTLTYPQWSGVGSPAPETWGHVPGSAYHRWDTAGELFVVPPDRAIHKLTYAEWTASGFHAFVQRVDQGFAKLTWSADIALMTSLAAGQGSRISGTRWQAEAYPTPRAVVRFPNDEFYRYSGRDTIYYRGPTMHRPITFAEWRAAGYPQPTVKGAINCSLEACVALTFDDGPSAHTDRLVSYLASNGIHATFFMVGQSVVARPETVARAYANGFEIENHTYTHPQLTTLTRDAQLSEVSRTDSALRARGVPTTASLRPPFGSYNASTRTLGKPLILWSVDPRDWETQDSGKIRAHIAANTRAGSVVLMHDTISATVDAVPGIIADLKARGFTFVTVKELRPDLQPGDILYSRTNIIRAGTTSTATSATVTAGDGELLPVVDEAPYLPPR